MPLEELIVAVKVTVRPNPLGLSDEATVVVVLPVTEVVAVALSSPGLPSAVADVTVAVLLMTSLPAVAAASTATVSVNTSLPTAKDGLLH